MTGDTNSDHGQPIYHHLPSSTLRSRKSCGPKPLRLKVSFAYTEANAKKLMDKTKFASEGNENVILSTLQHDGIAHIQSSKFKVSIHHVSLSDFYGENCNEVNSPPKKVLPVAFREVYLLPWKRY